jgi:uncharacterized sporulation protein YeaH/YhbH (DUF444 family)
MLQQIIDRGWRARTSPSATASASCAATRSRSATRCARGRRPRHPRHRARRGHHIPKKDISEPVFHHGQGGKREMVHPGNQGLHVRGDRIERPRAVAGGGRARARPATPARARTTSSSPEQGGVHAGLLRGPGPAHLVRTQLAEVPEWKSHRAGFTSDGTPNNLHVVRSMRGALGRRIALGPSRAASCASWKPSWPSCARAPDDGDARSRDRRRCRKRSHALRGAWPRIPYLDPIDLRFPQPRARAGAHQQGGDVLPDGRVRARWTRRARTWPSASSSCCTCS